MVLLATAGLIVSFEYAALIHLFGLYFELLAMVSCNISVFGFFSQRRRGAGKFAISVVGLGGGSTICVVLPFCAVFLLPPREVALVCSEVISCAGADRLLEIILSTH